MIFYVYFTVSFPSNICFHTLAPHKLVYKRNHLTITLDDNLSILRPRANYQTRSEAQGRQNDSQLSGNSSEHHFCDTILTRKESSFANGSHSAIRKVAEDGAARLSAISISSLAEVSAGRDSNA
jgi:hypothetical protein